MENNILTEEPKIVVPENDYQRLREVGDFGYPVQLIYFDVADLFMSRLRWHWHAEVEFFYVEKGSAIFLSDDNQIKLSEGQALFINQNLMHAIRLEQDDVDHCGIYSFKFHPAYIFSYSNLALHHKYISPLLNSTSLRVFGITGSDSWENEILQILKDLISCNTKKEFGYELETKALLCNLTIKFLQKIALEKEKGSIKSSSISLDESRVKDAIQYIELNYGNHITLDDLASAVHISKSECCRCFKRVMDLSPFEYLTKYRILQSGNILLNDPFSIDSISDLAFKVGFNSASYFNKVFKQYMGCTPSEYKKQLKNIPLEI